MNIKGMLVSGTVAAVLLASAAPALAHEREDGTKDRGLHVGWYLGAKHDKGDDDGEERRDKKVRLHDGITIGTVLSVDGSTFVFDPVGKRATTTVSASGALFTAHGQATTSAALAAGAKVMVIGTTTATSTAGSTITASLVHIFTTSWGHLKHWLGLH